MYSPAGVRTILVEHNCSTNGIDTTFDDAAPQKWSAFCPTELGRGPYQSNEPLANFKSDPSSIGTWRLAVENDRNDDRVGYITGFAVTITGTRQLTPHFVPETIVNTASRVGNTIAPGQLVSIYGVSLGPTAAASAPGGQLPTSLGGVRTVQRISRADQLCLPISCRCPGPLLLNSWIASRHALNARRPAARCRPLSLRQIRAYMSHKLMERVNSAHTIRTGP